jgi:DNA mismatch repair protein MutS
VVFLRKIVPGAASRSYGIQVAKLAGLPEAVLRRAREILGNLEAQELDESGRPALAGSRQKRRAQLGLFASEAPSPPLPEHALIAALKNLDLTRTTPLDALLWLTDQQKKLR